VRVSAKVDYAVRAAIELARAQPPDASNGPPVKGHDVADAQDIPVKFLENILSELRRAGIVGSQRGADGGYWLAKPAGAVSIADIIRAVEGPLADVHGTPPEKLKFAGPAKPLKDVWVAARAGLRSVLEEVTLADIVAGDLPDVVAEMTASKGAWSRR
jgi:Rrf2 family protein